MTVTKPIILWHSERSSSIDDAGITVLRSTGPSKAYFQPGPYYDEVASGIAENHLPHSDTLCRIPPLSYFCIKSLVKAPELVYHYGLPRPYCPPASSGDPDILQALIPRNRKGDFDLSKVDPRLWAIIVRVYSDLPHTLRTYHTALSDKYIPLLQYVPATEHFSLLTVLELPGCTHLNDDTIVHLTALHTLCVLDASRSTLSALGIRRLSGTLRWAEDGIDTANRRRGPWQLRILRLHNCKQVTNSIYQYLESFILLVAVDLRCTSCTWDREKIPSSFFPAVEKRLYHPTSPIEALSLLSDSHGLLPSRNSYVLHIDHLTHASRERRRDFGKFSDIGSSVIADNLNPALLAYHGDNCSPNFSTSSCQPGRDPSFQRPPQSCPADEVPQGSSMEESEETALHAMHVVVSAESSVYAAQHKAKMFYSRDTVDTGSSMAHSPRKWGQELLMLYREPPPWSQVQLPPAVKEPRARSLEEVPIDRTNEQALKSVQEMLDMLSERHRFAREIDGSCGSVKASTSLSASRNPFAVPFGKSSSHAHKRANEETPTSPPHTNPVTKIAMVAPPKFLRSLRPISGLPMQIPPDSPRSIPVHDGRDSGSVPSDPRRSHDMSGNYRPVSRKNKKYCGQKADMLACPIQRSAEIVKPTVVRKRPRGAASTSRSSIGGRGFDWSSWGTP